MATEIKAQPDWLRASASSMEVGVDREASVLRGYVVAQEGAFKDGRGEFSLASLKKINALMNKEAAGLKSRFSHPTLSGDGLGKYLGRAKNPRLDSVKLKRGGEVVLLHAVRADLHFDQTALEEPPGGGKPLGLYVMDLAESDPEAISSSLVLKSDQIEQLDPKTKRPKLGADGQPLPPLWMPTELHASDVVDVGAAVDGILSAHGLNFNGLPDALVRQASEMLNGFLPGESREVVEARLRSWLDRYLELRYGEDEPQLQSSAAAINASAISIEEARRRLFVLENE